MASCQAPAGWLRLPGGAGRSPRLIRAAACAHAAPRFAQIVAIRLPLFKHHFQVILVVAFFRFEVGADFGVLVAIMSDPIFCLRPETGVARLLQEGFGWGGRDAGGRVQRERPVLRALPAELQSAARAQPSRSGLAGVRRPALVARGTIPRSR